MARRIVAALDEIAARHPGGRVIVVTHGGVIGIVKCMVQSLPPAHLLLQRTANAEVVSIEWPLAASLAAWFDET
jgi:broad specificity phosphatase PhoE